MNRLRHVAAMVLLILISQSAGAVEIFPLDEIEPGLIGTALTVFQGDSITPFEVEIIDRVSGRGPYDLILVRALGERLQHDGVSQGMSGSPVYIDGRLAGALAFNFPFAKDPLAFMTPIAAMLDLATAERNATRADGGRALGGLGVPLTSAVGITTAAELQGVPPVDGHPTRNFLAVSGISPSTLGELDRSFGELGLYPMGAVTAGDGDGDAGDPMVIKPGSAVAIELLRGPVRAAAIGTVTHVEGGRIWAFGHPFLEEGAVSLPMAGARVHAVIPNLMNSFKMASVTGSVGTVLYDGKAGILGQLGAAPEMLPLRIRLHRGGEVVREADFKLAHHERMQAGMARLAMQGWLQDIIGGSDLGRISLILTIVPDQDRATDFKTVTVRRSFSAGNPLGASTQWLQAMVDILNRNPAGPLPLDSLMVDVTWEDHLEPLELLTATVDRSEIKLGQEWVLHVRMRGEREIFSRTFHVPASFPGEAGADLKPGEYTLHLGDTGSFEAWNVKRRPELFSFDDHRSLLRVLGRLESESRWVVWLSAPGRRWVVGGEEVPLPAYYRQLLPESSRSGEKKPQRLIMRRDLSTLARSDVRGYRNFKVVVSPQSVRSVR